MLCASRGTATILSSRCLNYKDQIRHFHCSFNGHLARELSFFDGKQAACLLYLNIHSFFSKWKYTFAEWKF
jgi:hypothetical protein